MEEIVVSSKENIKPSSPTPSHLRHFQLSFLDQITRQSFIPMIYFYPSPPPNYNLNISNHLKNSLSHTLSHYYPLAGRLRQNLYVDCNDYGVEYFEAKVNSQLSQFLGTSDLSELNILLPYKDVNEAGDLPLAIQVNFFKCGGIVIATCFNHKLSDGVSLFTFMKFWACVSRGCDLGGSLVCPEFGLAKLFPPVNIPNFETKSIVGIKVAKSVAKRFVFSASSISTLRAKFGSNSVHPTRVEALSSFIWTRYVRSTQGNSDPRRKIFLVLHMMNLRARLDPPLPDSYFGNLVGSAVVVPSVEGEGFDLVSQTRDALMRVDGDYVKRMQESFESSSEGQNGQNCEIVQFTFSSVGNLPVYEADFGWGRPEWVTMAKFPSKDIVLFMPTRSGKGMEALFFLTEHDMVKLEADKEFIAFVSPPSGAKGHLLSSL